KLDVLIYGHSHQAELEKDGEVTLFNPGSAGKRRFSLRPAVGIFSISEYGKFVPEVRYLDEK
nr:metallophosphoesterase family protein [candidate division KSB1 bacterium]NIR71717.1 metallophosphoesterase family protein [candidate division KSB1 bacterium]NIS28264.1 metallophosphoesterase family protein [candidate division KSB1 bacterium]NIT70394.1 metallophosphoesterase family protein [candidate division KSB1 bacterium]NIU28942.1 metallophosphoesterase family protein [candidate division KSB1 bacterium]